MSLTRKIFATLGALFLTLNVPAYPVRAAEITDYTLRLEPNLDGTERTVIDDGGTTYGLQLAEVRKYIFNRITAGTNVTISAPTSDTISIASSGGGGGSVYSTGTYGDIAVNTTPDPDTLSIVDNAVDAAAIATGAVATAEILDGTIVDADVSASAAIAHSKLATMAAQTFLGNSGGATAAPAAITVTNAKGMLQVTELQTLSGVAAGATNLGTFGSGTIVTDNATIKDAIDELDVAVSGLSSGTVPDADYGDITVDAASAPSHPWTIDDNAVDAAAIAADAVGASEIAANAVGASELADNAVDTAAIAASAVTYAKIQNVSATSRLLGRSSAGAGVVEEVTPANARAILDVDHLQTLTGVSTSTQEHLGTFPLTTISDNVSIKTALEELEAAVEAASGGGGGATNLGTTLSGTTVTITSSTGTDAVIGIPVASGNAGVMSGADKAKLDGIASGATANSSDATLLNRANHTGTQAASTVTLTTNNFMVGASGVGSAVTASGAATLLDLDHLRTLVGGAASTSDHFGTWSDGDVIDDNSTVKAALADLEDAITAMTPADVGLVGNGIADDTEAIQTKLDAGGRIYLPPGTYRIAWTSTTEGVDFPVADTHIIGAGPGLTKIMLHPDSQPTESTSYGIYVKGVRCSISNLTIEAGANTGISPSVKRWRMVQVGNPTTNVGADYFKMSNVDLVGPEDAAITTTFSGSPVRGQQGPCTPFHAQSTDYIEIDRCHFRGSTGHGVTQEGSFGAELLSCERVRIANCNFRNNYWDGLKVNSVGGSGPSKDWIVSNCYFINNGNGIYNGVRESNGNSGNANAVDADGDLLTFTGCIAIGNYGSQLQAKQNSTNHMGRVTFVNCIARDAKPIYSTVGPSSGVETGQAGFQVEAGDAKNWVYDTAGSRPTVSVKFIGCTAQGNSGHGFAGSYTNNSIWSGCHSLDNGGNGFSLQSNTAYCKIDNCVAEGNGTAAGDQYGIFMDGGVGHIISNNYITGLPSLVAGASGTHTAYVGQTQITARGIQLSAGGGQPIGPHFIFNNVIGYVTNPIHNTSTTACRVFSNYNVATGALLTPSGTAPLP